MSEDFNKKADMSNAVRGLGGLLGGTSRGITKAASLTDALLALAYPDEEMSKSASAGRQDASVGDVVDLAGASGMYKWAVRDAAQIARDHRNAIITQQRKAHDARLAQAMANDQYSQQDADIRNNTSAYQQRVDADLNKRLGAVRGDLGATNQEWSRINAENRAARDRAVARADATSSRYYNADGTERSWWARNRPHFFRNMGIRWDMMKSQNAAKDRYMAGRRAEAANARRHDKRTGELDTMLDKRRKELERNGVYDYTKDDAYRSIQQAIADERAGKNTSDSAYGAQNAYFDKAKGTTGAQAYRKWERNYADGKDIENYRTAGGINHDKVFTGNADLQKSYQQAVRNGKEQEWLNDFYGDKDGGGMNAREAYYQNLRPELKGQANTKYDTSAFTNKWGVTDESWAASGKEQENREAADRYQRFQSQRDQDVTNNVNKMREYYQQQGKAFDENYWRNHYQDEHEKSMQRYYDRQSPEVQKRIDEQRRQQQNQAPQQQQPARQPAAQPQTAQQPQQPATQANGNPNPGYKPSQPVHGRNNTPYSQNTAGRGPAQPNPGAAANTGVKSPTGTTSPNGTTANAGTPNSNQQTSAVASGMNASVTSSMPKRNTAMGTAMGTAMA